MKKQKNKIEWKDFARVVKMCGGISAVVRESPEVAYTAYFQSGWTFVGREFVRQYGDSSDAFLHYVASEISADLPKRDNRYDGKTLGFFGSFDESIHSGVDLNWRNENAWGNGIRNLEDR